MKRTLLTGILVVMTAIVFISCNKAKDNDYAVTWGPQNVAMSFEGNVEEIDSLNAMAEQIMNTVCGIYNEELMKIDAEQQTAMLVFRKTNPKEVKKQIAAATDKVEQTLTSINTPTTMDGLYFEVNITMKGITEEYEETIYTESFGDANLLHK